MRRVKATGPDPEKVAVALQMARYAAHLAEPAYAPGEPHTDHSDWTVEQLRELADTAPPDWTGTKTLRKFVRQLEAAEAGRPDGRR